MKPQSKYATRLQQTVWLPSSHLAQLITDTKAVTVHRYGLPADWIADVRYVQVNDNRPGYYYGLGDRDRSKTSHHRFHDVYTYTWDRSRLRYDWFPTQFVIEPMHGPKQIYATYDGIPGIAWEGQTSDTNAGNPIGWNPGRNTVERFTPEVAQRLNRLGIEWHPMDLGATIAVRDDSESDDGMAGYETIPIAAIGRWATAYEMELRSLND